MTAERKYNNGEGERKEEGRQGKQEGERKRLTTKHGHCVKCNTHFVIYERGQRTFAVVKVSEGDREEHITYELHTAAPNAEPRWSKFTQLVTCPVCYDDEGHAGIIGKGTIRITDEILGKHRKPGEKPNPIALWAADKSCREVLDALGNERIEQTARALIEHRQITEDFARWLTEKGVRVGTIEELRTKVSASTFSELKVPRSLDLKAKVFFLPLRYYLKQSEPYFVGLQIRQTAKDAEPRYITVRLNGQTPLVHFALPTTSEMMNERVSEVWLTEGYFKAEAIAFYRRAIAIGALGAIAHRDAIEALMDAALWWQEDANLFAATVILAPDADYREKYEVAKATWEAKRLLERKGFRTRFAIWDKQWKGIDDALDAGIEPFIVDEDVFLATLPRKVRDALLRTKVKTRVLLDREIGQSVELPESKAVTMAIEAEKYETEKRKQYWLDTLTDLADKATRRCTTVIIDTSPAGTGKTKTAATLRLRELKMAGIAAKRLVYIAPEIKRAPVPELERFRLFVGRDTECVYYERLQELEQKGLTHIGRKICAHCPMRKLCGYYAQKQTGRRYCRISWQSYSPREGDFVILDEFSRLNIFRHYEVTKREFDELIRSVDRYGASPALMAALKQLRKWLNEGDKTDEEVKRLLKTAPQSAYDWFAHEINTLHSNLREMREWVFRKREERPKAFYWAETIADIMRGLKVGQVWVERGKLKIMVIDPKLKSLAEKAAGILILDATVNPTEVWELLKMPVVSVTSDEPQIYPTVIQVPLDALSHRASQKRKEERLRLAKAVLQGLKQKGLIPKGAKVGVLTHKDAAEVAQGVFGKKAVIGWWGRDERATNVFYERGCNVLVCVGLPHRNIGAIAAEKGKAGYKLKALRKVRLDREGKWWTVIKEFADEELAAAVRREVAVAYLQAAGRLRQNRRSEQCYVVVVDTEPLPLALNPVVIPPEQVLPPEIMQAWKARQQRGLAMVNALKRKIAAERIEKAIKAVITYRAWTGEEPDAGWIAKVIGTRRRQAWEILKECDRLLAPESKPKERKKEVKRPKAGSDIRQPAWWQIANRWKEAKECVKVCSTFALSEGILPSHLFITNVVHTLTHPHLAPAVAAFLLEGYPVPYRALARRFGVHMQKVRRVAQRMRKFMEEHGIEPKPIEERLKETYEALQKPLRPPENPPPCPECGTELEPEPLGNAVCVGCGREWQWLEDHWVRVRQSDSDLDGGFG